ncbi:MAG: hypothetical protein COT89_01555 [Candidatus Colwellbacteria bacterium CG10_big_fil_rev_8_21_14_0_10_42_22]|uniref:PD-(D/E)XK nuclease domain-containing protein n=1 Tax=Candidatus Colwellbacteria bacterium CG10_big_fil_rev_8_21_14_0_10_42_22 TaxID=1974540 RepID=A0A2H0VG27_9BACT|nr:MAG: hypothetical protein COT89_01555 [Candidatus Colwellbacteria bacterium CG10_big_fil_rev_8_21_14_0_10_42_22]
MEKKTNSLSETTPTNKANKTGNQLEQFVARTLESRGYTEFWNHKKQVFENRKAVGGKQYAQQVPCGTSIYETQRKCDFLVLNKEKFPEGLIIECKWQQSSGSVDEKYPFSLFNIIKIGVPTIILLDGGGYKKAAMDWLKDQVDPRRALIGVYSMSEFQTQVNNGFLG